MQYSTIENTDVRVSRISFGTASLHHLFSARQRQQVLEATASAGISHFDTSPYYGCGLAEADLGEFMEGRRDVFTVATKVGLYPFGGAAHGTFDVWVRKAAGKIYPRLSAPEVDWRVQRAADSLNASLKRLKTDYVDFLFLHEPDISLVDADEFLHWIEAEQSKGKIRHWGLAGLPVLLEPWLQNDHPLALVLQTRDCVDGHQADFILNKGRSLQFTYGYLSSQLRQGKAVQVDVLIHKALIRNTQGSILVSTCKAARINEITRLAE
ncbi:aldo/keto reductase [Methylococcus mesophilus]|uniref:aldo/keto reductase n=1 Tax=Methylococcus mesophilus TaxID=2993564 RepID=UPI00224B0CF3|nr:aldo/keto reductase [Methylococcus mesophilus]UZR28740.1 aldo/keto reductase [Methylococcus mesophilus]